jgi:hypothetical protein
MSTFVPMVSVMALASLSWIGRYSVREYYLPLKDQHAKDKERIHALEEEITRLKREMRICGIPIPPCHTLSVTPTRPIQKSQDVNSTTPGSPFL